MYKERDYLTTEDVAREVGVCGKTIRVWAHRKFIPFDHMTLGGHFRFNRENLKVIKELIEKENS